MTSRADRPPAHSVRPDEIRRRGFAWPPAGIDASAYPTDARGRVHLDAILADLRGSLSRWRRELGAARAMTAEASRDSFEAYDEAMTGCEDLGARIATIRDAITEVERITARLDRSASRRTWWRRAFLGTYLLLALIGGTVHAWAFSRTPTELPNLSWSGALTEAEASKRAVELHGRIRAALPAPAQWLAPSALFWVEDDVDTLVAPSRWVRENTTLRERVDRLNRSIDGIPVAYRSAGSLLLAIFGVGFFSALLAVVRPGLLAALSMCLAPLFATPIATEPLIGVDNPHLLHWTLPLLVPGSGFLWMQATRAMRSGLMGPRGDHWLELWVGLALIVLGTGVTIAGILLATRLPGAAVLSTAVVPALYGLYLTGRGVWGLLRSVGRRRGGPP